MITLCRATDRRHDLQGEHEVCYTFPADGMHCDVTGGFGDLEQFGEDRLPPCAIARAWPPHDHEVITYVRQGALSFEDSLGRTGLVRAGEFQRMTTGHRVHHKETNPSQTDWAQVFRLWLRPSEPLRDPDYEQKRFSIAERRARLRVVAALDGREGSLRVHQDVFLYSSILDEGQHVVHPLREDRIAWLHLVQGEVSLGDLVVFAGDGAGYSDERAVSLTAREATEILLVDVKKSLDMGMMRLGDNKGAASAGLPVW